MSVIQTQFLRTVVYASYALESNCIFEGRFVVKTGGEADRPRDVIAITQRQYKHNLPYRNTMISDKDFSSSRA